MIGAKIYTIFSRPETWTLIQHFICDFNKIKNKLGIVGNYLTREGNILSKNFNPKRNKRVLFVSIKEMENIANNIYINLMQDLETIGTLIHNN